MPLPHLSPPFIPIIPILFLPFRLPLFRVSFQSFVFRHLLSTRISTLSFPQSPNPADTSRLTIFTIRTIKHYIIATLYYCNILYIRQISTLPSVYRKSKHLIRILQIPYAQAYIIAPPLGIAPQLGIASPLGQFLSRNSQQFISNLNSSAPVCTKSLIPAFVPPDALSRKLSYPLTSNLP